MLTGTTGLTANPSGWRRTTGMSLRPAMDMPSKAAGAWPKLTELAGRFTKADEEFAIADRCEIGLRTSFLAEA